MKSSYFLFLYFFITKINSYYNFNNIKDNLYKNIDRSEKIISGRIDKMKGPVGPFSYGYRNSKQFKEADEIIKRDLAKRGKI